MAICLLSPEDLQRWGKMQKRPGCEFHHHAPYHKAAKMVDENEAFWIPGQRAVVVYSSNFYVWKTRYSAGFAVMQLVSLKSN